MKKLIKTLLSFTFTKVDGQKLIGEGIEVSYNIKLANRLDDFKVMPLQMVIQVRLNGEYAYTWGCVSNEENSDFALWFVQTSAKVQELEFDAERKASTEAKSQFLTLLEKA
jgi:hypothetical protein